jgi:hypothetical protein
VAQIWSTPSAQGFAYRQHGTGKYNLVDFEGMALAMRPPKKGRKRRVDEQM